MTSWNDYPAEPRPRRATGIGCHAPRRARVDQFQVQGVLEGGGEAPDGAVDAAGARGRGDNGAQVLAVPILGALQRGHATQDAAGGVEGAPPVGQEHAHEADRADGGRGAPGPEEAEDGGHPARGHAGSGTVLVDPHTMTLNHPYH